MNLSLIKITSLFPLFNEVAITAEDFWRVAKREHIVVRQLPLMVDGYYTLRRGRGHILINSRLEGLRWLHTALHELHHHMFDVPGEADGYTFYRRGAIVDRRECRADAFALVGILPWPDLVRMSNEDLTLVPTLAELVRDRIAVRTHFGL